MTEEQQEGLISEQHTCAAVMENQMYSLCTVGAKLKEQSDILCNGKL